MGARGGGTPRQEVWESDAKFHFGCPNQNQLLSQNRKQRKNHTSKLHELALLLPVGLKAGGRKLTKVRGLKERRWIWEAGLKMARSELTWEAWTDPFGDSTAMGMVNPALNGNSCEPASRRLRASFLQRRPRELGGGNRQGARRRSLLWESDSHEFEPSSSTAAELGAGCSPYQLLKPWVSQL